MNSTIAERERAPHYRILILISIAHFLSDLMTSVVPAMLPVLQRDLDLTYVQLGVVVTVSTLTASIIQPVIGMWIDRKSFAWLLPLAAVFSGIGLASIALVNSYVTVLLAVIVIGLGSAAFHPEGSRVAYLAAGSRRGLAQSIFQVGGNAGQSMGPLMIPLFFLPFGLKGAYWLLLAAVAGGVVLVVVARWYNQFTVKRAAHTEAAATNDVRQYGALVLLVIVVSMRSWIHSGVQSFLPLYYVNVFGWTVTVAEVHLFLFLFAGAAGTFVGGALSDRFGKKNMLMFSMWAPIPFIVLLPYLAEPWSYVNVLVVGFMTLSSFAVTVVYAQQLFPGNVGLVSGLMIGFAIGMGGIGASVMGGLADWIGLTRLIQSFALLTLAGWLMGIRLPNDKKPGIPAQKGISQ